MSSSSHNDLRPLAQAMSSAVAVDGVQNALTLEQWDLLAPYLVPVTLAAGELLFAEGSLDRNLYFVESGSLSVHYQDAKERILLAIVSGRTTALLRHRLAGKPVEHRHGGSHCHE